MITALAAALLLAAEAPPRPPRPPEDGRPDPARPALSQEDEAVIQHLELLQKMELLRDLDVVDAGEEEKEGEPAKER